MVDLSETELRRVADVVNAVRRCDYAAFSALSDVAFNEVNKRMWFEQYAPTTADGPYKYYWNRVSRNVVGITIQIPSRTEGKIVSVTLCSDRKATEPVFQVIYISELDTPAERPPDTQEPYQPRPQEQDIELTAEEWKFLRDASACLLGGDREGLFTLTKGAISAHSHLWDDADELFETLLPIEEWHQPYASISDCGDGRYLIMQPIFEDDNPDQVSDVYMNAWLVVEGGERHVEIDGIGPT